MNALDTPTTEELLEALQEFEHRFGEFVIGDADVDLLRADLDVLVKARECIATLVRERDKAEADLERLYAVVGMGGYQGDAPEEMLVMADLHMGCDAWLYLERTHTMGGDRTNYDPKYHTPPVRYVRADLAPTQEAS